jgi:beta-galactosidase
LGGRGAIRRQWQSQPRLQGSGPELPRRSVGWYRKSFAVPASDLGRRISVEFDGVFRDSVVWINGFYLGRQPSGYTGFRYDLTDYLNYGGENVIAVRVDATMEEGWFYEGAGIYRHVWLTKTAPLHVAPGARSSPPR